MGSLGQCVAPISGYWEYFPYPEVGLRDAGVRSKADVLWRAFFNTPRNLVDGAWAPSGVGPLAALELALHTVRHEEMGEGRPERHHLHVWLEFLRSAGLPLPPDVSSAAFVASYPREAFPNAALSACAGHIYEPRTALFVAGFSLNLELLSTPATFGFAREYAVRGLNSKYYMLHASVDNPVSGHAAVIAQALEARVAGPAAWEQVYAGFVSFDVTQLSPTSVPLAQQCQWALSQPQRQAPGPARECVRVRVAEAVYTMSGVKACGYVVINGGVYDFARFMPTHPGDVAFGAIASWRGRDATAALSLIHGDSKDSGLPRHRVGRLVVTDPPRSLRDAMREILLPFVQPAAQGY